MSRSHSRSRLGARRAHAWIAAVALCLSCATPIEEQRWIRAETAHFRLISSAGKVRTREVAQTLEHFRAALIHLTPLQEIPTRIPTLVYVFGDSTTFGRFRWRSGVKGFMLPRDHQNYVAIDASDPDAALPTAQHEYVHFILYNETELRYPPWYHEGLAELLSTLHVTDTHLVVGEIPTARAPWLVYGNPLSLRRIMTAEDIRRWSSRALSMFYAQSWALTHFLHSGHDLGYANRYDAMVQYLRLLNRDLPPEEAFEQAFGLSFRELEKDLFRYVEKGEMAYRKYPLTGTKLSRPIEVTLDPLGEAEQLYLLGDLARALGADKQDLAARLLRAAIERQPEHARAHVGLAMLLAARGDPEADELLDRAVELDPEDPEIHRIKADSLAAALPPPGQRLDAEERRRVQAARDHYRRSLELDPEQVAAHSGLGRTYLWEEGDPAPGIRALEEARKRLPSSEQTTLALAQLYLRTGKSESARRLVQSALQRSHEWGLPEETEEEARLDGLVKAAGLGDGNRDPLAHLEAYLELTLPAEGEEITGIVALAPVRGRAGLGDTFRHDVVVAIDESSSTLLSTGQDVDGDGTVGTDQCSLKQPGCWRRKPDRLTSDFDDTILRSELLAAGTLLRRLDPDMARVALITFSGGARVRSPMGLPSSAMSALDAYEVRLDGSGTSLAAAMGAATDQLLKSRLPETRCRRSILLLSDGQPTVPSAASGRKQSLRVADFLGEYGIPVYAYALGREAIEGGETYREIAARTGGAFIPVEDPGNVIDALSRLRLTGLEAVTVRNLDTGAEGRALRVFPHGAFDAYVPLAPGQNEIEIRATLEGGREVSERRVVFFRKPTHPSEADLAAAAGLRRELHRRTLETELIMSRSPETQTPREIDVRVEETPEADSR